MRQQLAVQVTPAALSSELGASIQQALVPLQLQLQLLALGDSAGAAAAISPSLAVQGSTPSGSEVITKRGSMNGASGSGGAGTTPAEAPVGDLRQLLSKGRAAAAAATAAMIGSPGYPGSGGRATGSDNGQGDVEGEDAAHKNRKVKSGYTPYRPPVRCAA